MLNALKKLGRKILPKKLFKFAQPVWHGFWALTAHYYFGKPSNKLVVIGVTGTKGKTSTAHMIYQLINTLLEADNPTKASIPGRNNLSQCGLLSTAVVDFGTGETLNASRMTQGSGWLTHRGLKQMLNWGVKYAVIEVSSEGLAQNRHLGINFDVAVFTNLTPDHLESHGGFENYKRAKAKLFTEISKHKTTNYKKQINSNIQKAIIANLDSEHGLYYLNFPAQKHISYGMQNTTANLVATDIDSTNLNSKFKIQDSNFTLPLPGNFNIYNALATTAVLYSLGFTLDDIAKAVTQLRTIPGRMEILQKTPFTVLVDYAHEKASMTALYQTVKQWPHKRTIQVFGATGGVRDKSRRTDLGKLAGEFTDIAIITDEDPFDEDPNQIIHDIATSALATDKKTEGMSLFQIPDRKAAISKALSLAEPGDLVLITGKGAEQKIARAGGYYEPWDDRVIVKEILSQLQQ